MTNRRKQAKFFRNQRVRHEDGIYKGVQDMDLKVQGSYDLITDDTDLSGVEMVRSDYASEIVDIDTARRRLGWISMAEAMPVDSPESDGERQE